MSFNFKKFEHTNQRFEDRISVTSGSAFGFPTKFFNDNHLADYKYAVLFYDVDQKAVGIQFTNSEDEKHKFSVLKYKHGNGGSVIATSFFKSYNIDPDVFQGRYVWTKETDPNLGELYIIVLKENQRKKPVQSSSITETMVSEQSGSNQEETQNSQSLEEGGVPEEGQME